MTGCAAGTSLSVKFAGSWKPPLPGERGSSVPEIDRMNAADLAEALGAEVMGWRKSGSDWTNWEDAEGAPVDDALEPWNPGERIDEAWQVVERMLPKFDPGIFHDQMWGASFR